MQKKQPITPQIILPLLFIAGRILLFLALIPNNLHGFGDFPVYYNVANLPGLPYFASWSEYPPLFAFIIECIYMLSNGNQFLFDFILYLLLTICGAVCLWLFFELSKEISADENQLLVINLVYFAFMAFVSYTWWYFDLVTVMLMLLAIYLVVKEKHSATGLVLTAGILAKWFPLLLIPALFKHKSWKIAAKITAIAVTGVVLVWGALYLVSPTMTLASLQSQPSRASWQTIWALIDGNNRTGEFVPLAERQWPEAATFPRGNPARIPTLIPLIIFGTIGLWSLFRYKTKSRQGLLAMIGITWALFLLWSPGWSPQWILYLLPIILLTLPPEKGWLISFLFLLITLIEWPLLLKHNLYAGLWLVVPLRIFILCMLIFYWSKIIRPSIAEQQLTDL